MRISSSLARACSSPSLLSSPALPRRGLSVSSSDVKRKAVMVAATGQHHGKTTVTLGMVHELLARGRRVSYQKPVGQQTVPVVCQGKELQVDRDVDIFKHVWPQLVGSYSDASPVAFPPGFTRMVLDGKVQTRDLVQRCRESFGRLVEASDYVVVEGTGHIGVGSIIDLNNAQVAAELDLDVVMVAPGGLGVSFDVLAANHALLKEHGVRLKGVVLNKVDEKKKDMIEHYYRKALQRIDIPLLGVIPSDAELPLLSMKSFSRLLNAEFMSCPEQELRFFRRTRLIVNPGDLPVQIPANSLLILHSSRVDSLQALILQHKIAREQEGKDIACGAIVFGPERPSEGDIAGLEREGIPMLYVSKKDFDGTGFALLEKVMGHTHKHHKADIDRIVRTCQHVGQHIDLDAIIA